MLQLSLWGQSAVEAIAFDDIRDNLKVSSATINNWVRKGLLTKIAPNQVSRHSYNDFIKRQVGHSRLTSRANKLHKDRKPSGSFDLASSAVDSLAQAYEDSLPESYRNKEGIYYTPDYIVNDILAAISREDCGDKLFLEPCCGAGNFVLAAVDYGIRPENIYAFDTDETAVEITKKRLLDKTGYNSPNIICGDFLRECRKLRLQFDYIFTNPPWGKKHSKTEKEHFSRLFSTGKSSDTSSLFLYAALPLLKDGGKLGYLLPDSFFNISTFEDARSKCLKYKIERITDYGRPFKGLMTKAVSITLVKDEVCASDEVKCGIFGKQTYKRRQKGFAETVKHIFNFGATEEEAEVLEYLFKQEHICLKGNTRWALGVVTGDNKGMLHTSQEGKMVPIYRGKDIHSHGFDKPAYFIDPDLSGCQQVAPAEFYSAPLKIVYRFISDHIVCLADNSGSLVLNSANLFITDEDFPISMYQLSELLNSDLMNWLFRKIFATHKVLRGDLESLPIWVGYFTKHDEFDENKLLEFLNIVRENGTYRIKEQNHFCL